MVNFYETDNKTDDEWENNSFEALIIESDRQDGG
jgi:hypothetical protein